MRARLDAAREAQLRLAVYDAFDRRRGPLDQRIADATAIVDLHQRLVAEHVAEHGQAPAGSATLDLSAPDAIRRLLAR